MKQPKLYIHGENGLTISIFLSIIRENKLNEFVKTIDFPHGTPPDLPDENSVWLFPSFGRKGGFGEPDAMIKGDMYCDPPCKKTLFGMPAI